MSSKPPACQHCRAQAARQQQRVRAAGGTAALDGLSTSEDASGCPDFNSLDKLKHRPAFAWGLKTREIFAGTGRWTQAMKDAGIATGEPVEYYGQPLLAKDPRPRFDVRDPLVQERLLQEFSAPPGPEESNVLQFAPPCVSHCPWQLPSGGTRTFENPEGTNERQVEVEGTTFGSFTCKGALRG